MPNHRSLVCFRIASLCLASAFLLAGQEKPVNINDAVKRAERQLDWQFFADARISYLDVLQNYPPAVGINEALGYICFKEQQYDEAVRYFEAELRLESGNDVTRLLLAITQHLVGREDQALELIKRVRSKPFSFFERIMPFKRERLGKYPYFQKFMKDNPGLVPFLEGVLLKAKGDYPAAEEKLDEAAARRYNPLEVQVQLFDLHLQQGELYLAQEAKDEIQQQDAQMAEKVQEILRAADRQKAKDFARSRPFVIRYCKEPISTVADDLNNMAQSAVKRGDIESALKTWKKALNADENRFDINYNMALILYLHDRAAESLYHCQRAIRSGDSQFLHWAYNLAGNICFDQGQYDQAISYYLKAIAIDSQYLKCRNNLAAAYRMNGDYENAEKEWRWVISKASRGSRQQEIIEKDDGMDIQVLVDVKEKSEFIESCKSLASLYQQQNRDARAVPLLESVLQVVPTDADTHFDLGKIFGKIGDKARAREHLELAIQNGTKNEPEARALLKEMK